MRYSRFIERNKHTVNYPVACTQTVSTLAPFALESAAADPNQIYVPATIAKAMSLGATLAISVSGGGKDSTAMLRALVRQFPQWKDQMVVIFADLGRSEWLGVTEYLHRLCAELGLELQVTRREKGALMDRFHERFETIKSDGNQVPWVSSSQNRYCQSSTKITPLDGLLRRVGAKPWVSSSVNRYCQSDTKIAPINGTLRDYKGIVICAIGIRAEESPHRAKEPAYAVRNAITTESLKCPHKKKDTSVAALDFEQWADQTIDQWLLNGRKGRLAFNWHPIQEFSLEQVWAELGTTIAEVARRAALFAQGQYRKALAGFHHAHWSYVAGASRHSCSMCIFSSAFELGVGAKFNPLTWLELALLELESGWSFKADLWLANLRGVVRGMTPARLKLLYGVLYELQLVKRWGTGFNMAFLATTSPELLGFYTFDFLTAIVKEDLWQQQG